MRSRVQQVKARFNLGLAYDWPLYRRIGYALFRGKRLLLNGKRV